MACILLIDDDKKLAESVCKELVAVGHAVECLNRAEPGLERLSARRFDIVLLDNNIAGGMTGLEFLPALGEQGIKTPVILMTGESSTDTAIDAMRKGAFEYVIKAGTYRDIARSLLPHIEEAVKISAIVPEVEVPDDEMRSRRRRAAGGQALISNKNQNMVNAVVKPIVRNAANNRPVLILGETGTGKDLVAKALHTQGPRKSKPFVAMNCAEIPEANLASELFGTEGKRYTGVDFSKGKLEHADGGTFFLDEIGDMPLTVQPAMLRVLENRTFERLGGSETVCVDIRFVFATHKDLRAMVAAGTFRRDLFFRLDGIGSPIEIPPLRDRLDDLPDLVEYFQDLAAQAAGKECRGITPEALQRLHSYSWPGNVRELQNVIFGAVGRCRGNYIVPADLVIQPTNCDRPTTVPTTEDEARAALQKVIAWAWATTPGNVGKQLTSLLECELLRVAQAECNGNKTEMGKRVDMVPNTVRKMMKEYGLE